MCFVKVGSTEEIKKWSQSHLGYQHSFYLSRTSAVFVNKALSDLLILIKIVTK